MMKVKETEKVEQVIQNPLFNLRMDHFSNEEERVPDDDEEKLDSARHRKPAKKVILSPDLVSHQKQITGIVQKKLAFSNASNDFVSSSQ